MASVSFVLDAEEAKAVNAFLKVVDAQKKAETGFQRLNAKVDEHGKKTEATVNISARSMLEMAGGIGAVTLAWNAATGALQKYHEMHERAADTAKTVMDLRGEIFQLEGGREKVRQAEELAKASGMDLNTSYRTQFQVSSGTLTEADRQAIIDATGWAGNQAELSAAYVSARSSMKLEEVGGFREFVAKSIIASENSNANIAGLGQGLARVGGAVKNAGGSDEEALAYLATLTDSYGPEMAAEVMESLSTTIQKQGMEKMGFHAAIQKIGAKYQKLSGPERIKFITEEPSRRGFDIFDDKALSRVGSMVNEINKGNDTINNDVVGRRKVEFMADPINQALMRQRMAERLREVEEMNRLAPKELGLQAVIDEEIGRAHMEKAPIASVIARQEAMKAAKFLTAGPEAMRGYGQAAAELVENGVDNFGGEAMLAEVGSQTSLLKEIRSILAGILQKDNPAPKPTPNMQAE